MTEYKSYSDNEGMKDVKIKECPYCKSPLKLKYFYNPNDPEDEGYGCSNCGMFLDIELEGKEESVG